jgi:serine/threonine-protein kinase
MGEVYAATDLRLGRKVAIKALPEAAGEPAATALDRMRQEARALAAVDHPAVVEVFDLIEDGERVYIVMEHLDGESLDGRLKSRRRLAAPDVAALGTEILGALAAVHRAGIVHRDLKPGNIFLERAADGGERVRLLDFGISRLRPGESLVDTREGAVMGSVLYMAPEQLRDTRAAGVPADLWSVGAILFEALTGRPPFVADSWSAAIHQLMTATPPRVRDLVPAAPAPLAAAVDRALEREPERRHDSAAAMRDALAAPPHGAATATALADTADMGTVPEPPHDARRRRVWLAVAAAIGIAGVAAFGAAYGWFAGSATPGASPAPTTAATRDPAEPTGAPLSADAAPPAAGATPPAVTATRRPPTSPPPRSPPPAPGTLVVRTDDGANVAIDPGGHHAIARARRRGEHARATFELSPGQYRVTCRIGDSMDAATARAAVASQEVAVADCFHP